jgi:hypothetical protein
MVNIQPHIQMCGTRAQSASVQSCIIESVAEDFEPSDSGRAGCSSGENRFDANDMQGCKDVCHGQPRQRDTVYPESVRMTRADMRRNKSSGAVSIMLVNRFYTTRDRYSLPWSLPPNYATTNTLSTGPILCFVQTSPCHAMPLFIQQTRKRLAAGVARGPLS